MDRVGTQGNEKGWDFPILKEIEADIVKLKHKKDKSEQEHEILELVYLAEQIADHHLANPEKYLPPHRTIFSKKNSKNRLKITSNMSKYGSETQN